MLAGQADAQLHVTQAQMTGGPGFPSLFLSPFSSPSSLSVFNLHTHTHPPTLHTSQASDLFIHLLEVSVLPGITGVPTVLRAVQILVMLSQAPLM